MNLITKTEPLDPRMVRTDGGQRLRELQEDTVKALMESMGKIGLLEPILVYQPEGGGFVALISGLHRLEAARRLKWEMIDAIVYDNPSEVDRQLIELVENLHRAELTKAERDRHIQRYAELLKAREEAGIQVEQNDAPEIGYKKPPPQKKGIATKIAAETGLSKSTVQRALNPKPKAKPAPALAPAEPLPDFALSPTAQQKLEAHKRKLDREFDARVMEARQKWANEVRLPIYEKKLEEIEQMLKWPRNFVMTRTEYNAILRCLHPDSSKSRTEEQLAEAFRILTHYKLKMVDDAEERKKAVSTLPRTVGEMLARKAKRKSK